ncbi:hypothetical protein [uncultured Chloroflexus sp.]|uniref:hypothetical protein n=1 Tax=uncultured Chloroflexus sp. TaxID=214040 RepID=UPI00262A82E1|nr:hypothetical protein [uncultured Chloroflexus sp.]
MRAALREEWQRLIRRRRIMLLFISTVLVMLLTAQGTGQLAGMATLADLPLLNAQIDRLFATSLCLALQGWVMLLSPLLAVSAYTVGLQTKLNPIVLLARLLVVWAVMILAIGLTLPFFSLLPLFGSLSLPEIGWAFAVIVVTALLSGAYGVCWVTVMRNPPAALFFAYSVLALWLVVGVLIAGRDTQPTLPVVVAVAFNPFAALLAPLAPAFPPDGPIAADLQNLLRFTHGVVDRATPLYRLYIAGSGLLILVLLGIASFAVHPQPRRWQRFDTLFSIVCVVYLTAFFAWRDWWSVALP